MTYSFLYINNIFFRQYTYRIINIENDLIDWVDFVYESIVLYYFNQLLNNSILDYTSEDGTYTGWESERGEREGTDNFRLVRSTGTSLGKDRVFLLLVTVLMYR